MSKLKLTRRTVLRGMLGGAAISIALPPLEAFFNASGTALADGSTIPKRFGLFFWGNGVLPGRWVPPTIGENFELSDQLAPLASVREHLTVISGMKVTVKNTEPHTSGVAGILTGAPLLETAGHKTFKSPSIDQVIAATMAGKTRFRSLEFGAKPGSGVSTNGPDSMNPPERSPRAFFDRIFGSGFTKPGETGEPDPMLGLRRSILDAVMADVDALTPRLSSSDRQRLDQHLTGIRELEQRIAFAETHPPSLQACSLPGEPNEDYPDIEGRPQLSAIHRAMVDTMVMALACDQTRVFSSCFVESVSNNLFPGSPSGHHQLTHDEPGDQPEVHKIVLQIMQEFTYLIEKLKSVEEGDGTLLDRCLVLGTTDCSFGRTHALDEFPIVLAGNAGGVIKNNLHYRSTSGENASTAILSVLRAMDVVAADWGQDEAHVTDSLRAIEVV